MNLLMHFWKRGSVGVGGGGIAVAQTIPVAIPTIHSVPNVTKPQQESCPVCSLRKPKLLPCRGARRQDEARAMDSTLFEGHKNVRFPQTGWKKLSLKFWVYGKVYL